MVVPVQRLPGDYALPLGSRRGTDQHGELAVVEQAQRAEQPTAGRDRLSLYSIIANLRYQSRGTWVNEYVLLH